MTGGGHTPANVNLAAQERRRSLSPNTFQSKGEEKKTPEQVGGKGEVKKKWKSHTE